MVIRPSFGRVFLHSAEQLDGISKRRLASQKWRQRTEAEGASPIREKFPPTQICWLMKPTHPGHCRAKHDFVVVVTLWMPPPFGGLNNVY